MRLRSVIALVAFAAVAMPASAGAKSKPVSCKAGQVKVKAGKKKARCRSIRAVLPKPRAADPRVAFVQMALNLPVPKAKRKKARSAKRRARSLRRGFGRAGRRAYTKMLRALPKALAKVDARAPGRAPPGLARIATARAAQADPCGENADALGSNTTSDGGVITTTTLTRGGLGTTIVFKVGDLAFVIEYTTTVGCRELKVPKCPTASGVADAQSDALDRVRMEVRRDGRLVSSQRSSARRQTKTHGQTAGDALLDFVDVDDVVTINTTGNGVTIAGRLTRHTHINMRSEQVDLGQSRATFVGAAALSSSDNGSFAGLAAGIISTYRAAESEPDRLGIGGGWAVFDRVNTGSYCINGRFNPERRTIKVKKNTSGSFTGEAIAKSDGGVASDSRWEKAVEYNGTFTPRLSGRSVSSHYVVTNAGPNELLSVEYKVTSTAGVAKLTWSQDTEDTATINHIRGSFSGTQTVATILGPSVLTATGALAYDRFTPAIYGGADGGYQLASGSYTLVASGIDRTGVTGCYQRGSKTFAIPPGAGGMQVDGTGDRLEPPYTYHFETNPPPDTMTITRFDCPPGAEDYEGSTASLGVSFPLYLNDTHSSADGKDYKGSEDQTEGGSGQTFSWALTGTE